MEHNERLYQKQTSIDHVHYFPLSMNCLMITEGTFDYLPSKYKNIHYLPLLIYSLTINIPNSHDIFLPESPLS